MVYGFFLGTFLRHFYSLSARLCSGVSGWFALFLADFVVGIL